VAQDDRDSIRAKPLASPRPVDGSLILSDSPFMRQIGGTTALGILVLAALASECELGEAQAQGVPGVDARVVAANIPGAGR
jgi:hypothetical protein